jgi:ubiquitin carboxyl-terminal hydrolase 10
MTKKVTLESVPPVLILQLKRFTYNKSQQAIVKIKRDVSYPETLTLSPHYLSSFLAASLTSPPTYHLQSIIMHHGTTADGGHYTALCRGEISTPSAGRQTQWRHIDDTTINSAVTRAQVLASTSQAYLLFYCR